MFLPTRSLYKENFRIFYEMCLYFTLSNLPYFNLKLYQNPKFCRKYPKTVKGCTIYSVYPHLISRYSSRYYMRMLHSYRTAFLSIMSSSGTQRLVNFSHLPTISQHRLSSSPCFLYLSRWAPVYTSLNGCLRFSSLVRRRCELHLFDFCQVLLKKQKAEYQLIVKLVQHNGVHFPEVHPIF